MNQRKLLCVVMDGIGISNTTFGDAFAAAHTPHLEFLKTFGSYTELFAHGTHVGLPSDSDIGNSEVGHNALGAGQIYDQGAKLVQNAINDGSVFNGKTWQSLSEVVREAGSTLHFIGLLSDGNVHSHIDHLLAFLQRAKSDGIRRVRLHLLLDGRDVGEKSCEIYLAKLQKCLSDLSASDFDIQIASGGGRMTTTMDRYEADWTIVERGWKAHVLGEADLKFTSIDEAIKTFRNDEKLTDQFFPPFVITKDGVPTGTINDNDAVIFFNFRGDRAIEISRAFTESEFNAFDRKRFPKTHFAGMMEYDGDLHIPPKFLVSPPAFANTFGEHLATLGVPQFACSETQKYGHVTYFWNGNRSGKFDNKLETYVEVPSDNVPFEQKPWMKAEEICQETIKALTGDSFSFGRINFANGDMVGHTGDFAAAVVAVATVDMMIGRLTEVCRKTDTILLVTADHGNCDEMFEGVEKDHPGWQERPWENPTKPKTSHTKNKVPMYLYDPRAKETFSFHPEGGLGNLAATICDLIGQSKKDEFLPSLISTH